MKILDLCEFYSERGGGVRSYLTKLGAHAQAAGHQLVIVAPGPRDETREADGAIIERYSAPSMPYDSTYHMPLRLGRMRQLIVQHSPDVLQVSSPFIPALVASTLPKGRLPGALRSFVYHSDPIGCYLKPWADQKIPHYFREMPVRPAWSWMRRVCKKHDLTVVAGEWLQRDLTKRGCERVVNVDFGITHEDFSPGRAEAALRKRFLGSLADHPEARLLLIAGRLAADKRQGPVVDAVARLAARRPLGLVVLGDGPERENLMRAASGMAEAHFLKFTKDRDEYAAILATADALVHGSVCETYGFVLAETLASGTPILVPQAGGAAALAQPASSECYPALAGPDEIIPALERLLDRPREELRRAARGAGLAQPHTRDHFQKLFDLYEERLKQHHSALEH